VTLNITQKYLLNKAVKLPVHSARRKQVATEFHYERLFQVPFKLIGQDAAVQEVTTAILTHSLLGGTKPLILVFAGALWDLLQIYITVNSARPKWTRKDGACKTDGSSSVVAALQN
jgi:hypothetical protein